MQQIMEPNQVPGDDHSQIAEEFHKNLTLAEDVDEEEDQDDEEDDGDFEFSFGSSALSSPVSAEEVFQNGQIRPLFPSSDYSGSSEEATTSYGPPVRKLFVVSSGPENEDVAEGPYCAWSAKSPAPAPEMSRKSNSTGFSKLWKVKDLLVRSHSDGKDAFIFLTGKSSVENSRVEETAEEESKKKKKKVNLGKIKVESRGETASCGGEKVGKKKTTKSAYEALYGKREKKAGKSSYLPYRVGFFTNSNGISRNVHPY